MMFFWALFPWWSCLTLRTLVATERKCIQEWFSAVMFRNQQAHKGFVDEGLLVADGHAFELANIESANTDTERLQALLPHGFCIPLASYTPNMSQHPDELAPGPQLMPYIVWMLCCKTRKVPPIDAGQNAT